MGRNGDGRDSQGGEESIVASQTSVVGLVASQEGSAKALSDAQRWQPVSLASGLLAGAG